MMTSGPEAASTSTYLRMPLTQSWASWRCADAKASCLSHTSSCRRFSRTSLVRAPLHSGEASFEQRVLSAADMVMEVTSRERPTREARLAGGSARGR